MAPLYRVSDCVHSIYRKFSAHICVIFCTTAKNVLLWQCVVETGSCFSCWHCIAFEAVLFIYDYYNSRHYYWPYDMSLLTILVVQVEELVVCVCVCVCECSDSDLEQNGFSSLLVHLTFAFSLQEAFEKCWAYSPQRAASCPFSRCR